MKKAISYTIVMLSIFVLFIYHANKMTLIYVKYYDAKNPATEIVLIIDNDYSEEITLKGNAFFYTRIPVKLKPGIHSIAIKQNDEVILKSKIFVFFTNIVIEYTSHENNNEYTRLIYSHFGAFIPD